MKTYFTEICEAATGKAFVTEETIWETIVINLIIISLGVVAIVIEIKVVT